MRTGERRTIRLLEVLICGIPTTPRIHPLEVPKLQGTLDHPEKVEESIDRPRHSAATLLSTERSVSHITRILDFPTSVAAGSVNRIGKRLRSAPAAFWHGVLRHLVPHQQTQGQIFNLQAIIPEVSSSLL